MTRHCRSTALSLALALACAAARPTEPTAESTASRRSDAAWCEAALAIPSTPTIAALIDDPAAPNAKATRELVMSLTLSGGGSRAMLFHVGTLRRLNDAGMLPQLAAISSVSGGSVASAYLAHRWPDLRFDEHDRAKNFREVVEAPLRALAATTLDIPSALAGMLPFTSAAEKQMDKFDEHLFHGAKLSSIAAGATPAPGGRPRPLFVLNATSLQTGEHWQFRAAAMGGPITGWIQTGGTRLAEAVAASSGFPPLLSPMVLHPAATDGASWHECVDYRDNPYGVAYANEPGRQLAPGAKAAYREAVHLIDGGVRDNLGIAPIEEMNRLRRIEEAERSAATPRRATVTLISDGGATTRLDADPAANWAGQAIRVLGLLADQPDEVRVGALIRTGSARLRDYGWNAGATQPGCAALRPPPELEAARRQAALDPNFDAYAYWSIRRMPKMHTGFECPDPSPSWMADEVAALSLVPTAFRAMPESLQARLVNWGYLAAHHGLPYVDFAWPNPALRQRWLGPCTLPYGPEITDADGRAPSSREARCAPLVDPQAGHTAGAP